MIFTVILLLVSFDLSSSELSLIKIHNELRENKRVASLEVSQQLMIAARHHAAWMAINNKMSHYEGKIDLSYRVNLVGYSWSSIGENIAFGQETSEEVMKDWMNSPGHRSNILSNSYTEIGVGVVKASNGQKYWCTVFGNK